MPDVQDWDPAKHSLGFAHSELLNRIGSDLKDDKLQLSSEQVESLRSIYFISADAWYEFGENRPDIELVNWIKVLTLCPEQYPGFDLGARSPVIPLVRVLRRRNTYPSDLTSWIKQHSTNRFLPHGSLADRLS